MRQAYGARHHPRVHVVFGYWLFRTTLELCLKKMALERSNVALSTLATEMGPMNFSRFTLTAVAGVSLAAGVLLVASPASAAPSENSCITGAGCTFENANYGGGHINFTYNVKKFADIGYWVGAPTHWLTDNAASSVYNHGQSGQTAIWFKDPAYKG